MGCCQSNATFWGDLMTENNEVISMMENKLKSIEYDIKVNQEMLLHAEENVESIKRVLSRDILLIQQIPLIIKQLKTKEGLLWLK